MLNKPRMSNELCLQVMRMHIGTIADCGETQGFPLFNCMLIVALLPIQESRQCWRPLSMDKVLGGKEPTTGTIPYQHFQYTSSSPQSLDQIYGFKMDFKFIKTVTIHKGVVAASARLSLTAGKDLQTLHLAPDYTWSEFYRAISTAVG